MLGRLCAVGVLVWGLSGCAAALVVPPSRTDVGAVAATDSSRSAARVSAGVHYASATRGHNVAWDAGAGAIHEEEVPHVDAVDPAKDPSVGKAGSRYRTGGYLEFSRAIQSNAYQRSWLGLRAEALMPSALRGPRRDQLVYAVMARLSTELYATGAGIGAEAADSAFVIGGYRGTFAIGLYAEAGLRGQLDGTPAFIASSGLSLRLPFMAGAGVAVK